MNQHLILVREAIAANNGVWPDELYSGVMFWKGERITRKEFEELTRDDGGNGNG